MLDQNLKELDIRNHAAQEGKAVAVDGFVSGIKHAVDAACKSLLDRQHAEGYWCYELEADCTIPSEYILMMHFMDDLDHKLQQKLAVYVRSRQDEHHNGWPLYDGGDFDISGSVKAYYALKLAGDSPAAEHMVRAREAILAHGGAARSNVLTRLSLAMFQQLPWRGVPFIPAEIMLLPKWWWFPFHVSKVSYWSRTVMVPLMILYSLKARARNPYGIGIQELFTVPPDQEKNYFNIRSRLNLLFLYVERTARLFEPMVPNWLRNLSIKKAEQWFLERLNGEDGLGAIFPAMVNAHEALAWLGYKEDHPYRITTRKALQKLLVVGKDSAYCQPCVSPVWDTALAVLALQETGDKKYRSAIKKSLNWLKGKQLLDNDGDWNMQRPNLRGGGWPFQFANNHYPDLDDTAAVAWAMCQENDEDYRETISRAAEWIAGMQSNNGGYAAFDADNTRYYLNEIPFADHGALLDPPTSDVSARCLAFLSMVDEPGFEMANKRCLDYLRKEQEVDGSWFGRWGTNYIYGTWSVLTALEKAGVSMDDAMVHRAIQWLKQVQRHDGGWGESNNSYMYPQSAGENSTSTTFHTSIAMLGLMAAGEADSMAAQRGAEYLLHTQLPSGCWHDTGFNAPGFPRVFYLKYHGYDKFFPLWALARYYKLRSKQVR